MWRSVSQTVLNRSGTAVEGEASSGRQSIVRRLWRSFALLLAILVVSGVVSVYLLLEIVGIVRQILQVEDPLERAALEMEINAHEATEALFNFVNDPLQQYVDRFRDSNDDFRVFAEEFTGLLAGGDDAELGQDVLEIQRSYEALGERIMNTTIDRMAALETLKTWIEHIDELIDESLQRGLDTTSPDYAVKLHAALDMEINIDEAFGALESYAHRAEPILLSELEDAAADFRNFLAMYRATTLTPSERSVLGQVDGNFEKALTVGGQVVSLTDELRSSLEEYRAHLGRFDALMDEEVQIAVRERKASAHWNTERASWIALVTIVTMAIFVLAIAGMTTWITTQRMVRSFLALASGLDAYAQGDMEHRIGLVSNDELGKLGAAFNHMVELRRQATDALDEKNRVLSELSSKLSKYLSPQVYESIFRGEKDVVISTTRKKLTVLFADLKDFTETTDDLEPEELAWLLNDYLTEMSHIALACGATIDKYVGDAILLFFGDPTTLGVREDAVACVRMAIEMQRRMVDLRARWQDLGIERPLHMRIGINTGYCNVGNFGSEERMDYTIIGGEVNLAARLEVAAPVDGIMVAHETFSLIKDTIEAEEQRPIEVKGFTRPVRTYLVRGIAESEPGEEAFLRSDQDGVRVHIDLRRLDPRNRMETAERLEAYAKRLREIRDGEA